MSEYEAIERRASPCTRSGLGRELRALGVGATPHPVLAHTSLSSLGWTCGGAVAVCQALFDAVGPRGDLVMAAQTTDYSDPSHWTAPPVPPEWWVTIRREMPAFDAALAPTRSVGIIAETFRKWPGTRRSDHPSVSFSAHGPRAEKIVFPHPLFPSFGDGSPLGRLYEMDARILLLGVGYDACTALHLSESRRMHPPLIRQGAPLLDSRGKRQWREYEDIRYDADLFRWIGRDFDHHAADGDRNEGCVGQATAVLLRLRPLIDFGLVWLENHTG